jgi:hypothetical protein
MSGQGGQDLFDGVPLRERKALAAMGMNHASKNRRSPYGERRRQVFGCRRLGRPHFIVGMENSAPSLMPEGQREVTVLVLV